MSRLSLRRRIDRMQRQSGPNVIWFWFRWIDFGSIMLRNTGLRTLIRLGKRGLAADGLIPPYPSLTFPNHYSIVTGLYPEHHGIVRMTFYDPALGKHFSYRDPKAATDGNWSRYSPVGVGGEARDAHLLFFLAGL
jgi:predicted AlkP superfamily pyrophosphatase or phosphodiesterase